LVFNLTDSEIIMEIMNTAPPSWTSILTTHLYTSVVEFQTALKFHEDALIKAGFDWRRRDNLPSFTRSSPPANRTGFRNSSSSSNSSTQHRPRAYAVGWSKNLGKPAFPKDDSNLTKRNKTPAQANARPCRHCGSSLHWDNECKHAIQGNRNARANSVRFSEEEIRAQEEYEDLFY
ncbi:hypothetical protein SCHPADRAFT_815103, partial [Schizopora paradoxa]